MKSIRFSSLWAALLAPAALLAQTVTSTGTVSFGGGGAFLDGDKPSFQQITQHNKDGYVGIEEYRLVRESKESILTFDVRAILMDDTYKLGLRYEKPGKYYLDAGYDQFRVWYDGSGGYFRPTGTSFKIFDEDMSITRSKLWVEGGVYLSGSILLHGRYEHRNRNGEKSSTHWADTNLTVPYGTRNIVPSFYDIDESTNIFTLDLGDEAKQEQKWNIGALYQETKFDNKRNIRRRPLEPTADRIVTSKDETKTDLFAVHGYYLRQLSEQLTISGGALRTTLDSRIEGSRIYGQTYDPVYDPNYRNKQQRDEGYYDLEGDAEMSQTVLNLNAVYLPAKNWSVRPSLRYENLHQETMAEFIETNIGAAPTFPAIIEEVEGDHDKKWDEFSGALDVRYTGIKNWTFSGKGEWMAGDGTHEENRILHTGVYTVDRDMEYERSGQKYSLTSNWYAQPNLSFTAQYYFKGNVNDYNAIKDNTPPGTADRYPAFITDQDFEINDVNFRISWRPVSMLNLVTRYDYQTSDIVSQEAGLQKAVSSESTAHIFSQSITWSPTSQLYLTGNLNMVWDQMKTPAYSFVQNGDNNYVNASLGAGYALAKLDDIYVDYSYFRADNYIDNSATSLPYGVGQKTQSINLTWVRRQNANLVYTVRYGYMTNRDETWSGLNDFDAHMVYAKVQLRF
jgi:hypothetical protein